MLEILLWWLCLPERYYSGAVGENGQDDTTPGENPRLVSVLCDVLGENDPEGLIRGGAPADEYRPEAVHLARLSSNDQTITAEVVYRAWNHFFGGAGSFLRNASKRNLTRLADQLETAASRVRERDPGG